MAHKYNSAQRRELDEYVRARKAGIQPETTRKRDVEAAWRKSERDGKPFRADQ